MFAVIKTGGKQYKVTPGSLIQVNRLEGKEGAAVEIAGAVLVGGKSVELKDAAAKADIKARIVSHERGEKVIAFKKKRRHNYRRKIGHRQNLTTIEIVSINGVESDKPARKPAAKKAAPAASEKKATPKSAAPKAEKKPAAKKAEPKKTETKKPAAKKPAAKKSEK
jgi:large subunit ribosomal protein L21